jgi:hypothetical protein
MLRPGLAAAVSIIINYATLLIKNRFLCGIHLKLYRQATREQLPLIILASGLGTGNRSTPRTTYYIFLFLFLERVICRVLSGCPPRSILKVVGFRLGCAEIRNSKVQIT